MGKIFDSEEIFNLMQEVLTEVECLKHIMTGGATTISEKAHKKVQDTVEKAFNPLKPIKLSKEAYKKIEEADNEPISEEAKEAIDEFIKRTNKFYGTMEDKNWIQEKCNTNKVPKENPKEKPKLIVSTVRTREEVEDKLKQLKIAFNYAVLDRDKIQGWIEALEWMIKKHEN